MPIAELVGGIALTIFGVRFFRKALDRLFGGKMVHWISQVTENCWKAFGYGVCFGALAPSSTALALITMQMLMAGKFTSERMLAVLLGSNVGITITVQFLAFHIQDYAGIFIGAGVVMFQFLRREVLRGIGQCLLALGFIFLSMRLIGSSADVFRESPESRAWLQLMEGHPLILTTLVAVVTVCVQSSTASVGLALAFAGAGLVTTPMLIPWVIGANLGLSFTVLIAGWGTLEGRRLSVANLLVKVIVAAPLLFLPYFANLVQGLSFDSLERKIALFHTGFNVLVGLLALPFLQYITGLTRWMIVPHEEHEALKSDASYLDSQALDTPSLALTHATRETLQMADGIKVMLNSYWTGYTNRDASLIVRVQREDDAVDGHYRRIMNYLNSLREGMNEEEARWQFALLTFSTELEAVGDVIEKNLCDGLHKLIAENTFITPEDERPIAELYQMVRRRFDVAVSLLTTRNARQAGEFVAGKERLNEWCREVQKTHFERLMTQGVEAVPASSFFLEMLNSFRRINSHMSTIGYIFFNPTHRENTGDTRMIGESSSLLLQKPREL